MPERAVIDAVDGAAAHRGDDTEHDADDGAQERAEHRERGGDRQTLGDVGTDRAPVDQRDAQVALQHLADPVEVLDDPRLVPADRRRCRRRPARASPTGRAPRRRASSPRGARARRRSTSRSASVRIAKATRLSTKMSIDTPRADAGAGRVGTAGTGIDQDAGWSVARIGNGSAPGKVSSATFAVLYAHGESCS